MKKKERYKKFKAWVSESLGKMDVNEAFSTEGKNTKDGHHISACAEIIDHIL